MKYHVVSSILQYPITLRSHNYNSGCYWLCTFYCWSPFVPVLLSFIYFEKNNQDILFKINANVFQWHCLGHSLNMFR